MSSVFVEIFYLQTLPGGLISSLLIGFYYLQIFAGMRTQHTSTLRQAQPRKEGCWVLETSICLASFDLHMAFQICHLPSIYDGICHISWYSDHICHGHRTSLMVRSVTPQFASSA